MKELNKDLLIMIRENNFNIGKMIYERTNLK